MSEQQNTKLVQEAYAAFQRGDIQSILNSLAADVVWEVPGPSSIPSSGRYVGSSQVAQFFEKVAASMEFSVFEPRAFVAQGDRVVALGRYAGRNKNNGREYNSEWAMVFTVRNGKIAQFQEYFDTANLAAAYGASSGSAAH